jgi:methylmalonyl-CoA mutase N-terminal domain/subunit
VRTAIEALAGVLGGTQSLHTNSMDEAMALPTEKAARIALRTQQVIAYETNVVNVADPLGGSCSSSRSPTRWSAAPRSCSRTSTSSGSGSILEGCIRGIEENWFQGRIADSAYELERRFNAGQRIVVGVNRFTEGNDDTQMDLLEITNEDEARQLKRLDVVRHERNQAAVDAALARLSSEAADPEINLMPALIDAASAYATLGEIMHTLAGVFGRHVEVPTI